MCVCVCVCVVRKEKHLLLLYVPYNEYMCEMHYKLQKFKLHISNTFTWHLEADGVILSESQLSLRSQGNHPN